MTANFELVAAVYRLRGAAPALINYSGLTTFEYEASGGADTINVLATAAGSNYYVTGDGSGDIFIAFSTANPGAIGAKGVRDLKMLPNQQLNPIFLATVQATEEAIVNAMIAAETMKGIDDHEVIALPHDRLRAVLKKYNRLIK